MNPNSLQITSPPSFENVCAITDSTSSDPFPQIMFLTFNLKVFANWLFNWLQSPSGYRFDERIILFTLVIIFLGILKGDSFEESLDTLRVKIIEKDKERAEYLAGELNNTIIINGNALDEEVLVEANLEEAETVLALTNDDEDNLMVSVLVEKFAKDEKEINDKRTMALINKPNYSLLQNSLKIDDLIDPRMNTVSSILKHVHKGTIETAYTIMNGEYEVIEAEIIETSELINKDLKNSNLPEEIRIGAVLRQEKVIIPRSNFVFQKEDKVVFLAKKDSISVVENIFRISSI